MPLRNKVLLFLAIQAVALLSAVVAAPYYFIYLQIEQNEHVSELLDYQHEINVTHRKQNDLLVEQLALLNETIRINGESDDSQARHLERMADLTIKNTTILTDVIVRQERMTAVDTRILSEQTHSAEIQTGLLRSQSRILGIQTEHGESIARLERSVIALP